MNQAFVACLVRAPGFQCQWVYPVGVRLCVCDCIDIMRVPPRRSTRGGLANVHLSDGCDRSS